jgi:K+-transporting ATPase ATPase C chain
VKARIDTFRAHNPGVKDQTIPVDLITASGSGLDPHISPAAARIQIDRISNIRHIDKAKVEALVNSAIERPILGMGTERIHVLRLNVALDNLK